MKRIGEKYWEFVLFCCKVRCVGGLFIRSNGLGGNWSMKVGF